MYSELLRKLEKIVNIPDYNLVGVTKDKLYYISNEEGTYDLWVSDHEGKNKTKIASRPLNSSGVRKDKNKIYFDLDVTKGKELNKIFVWEEGKIKEIDMNPMRIFTMAYYKDNMVYAGSTMEENVVYLVRKDEEQEKIFSTDKWVFVSDINEDFIIGSGTLHGNPKSMELFIYDLNKNEYKIYTPKEGTFNMASSIFNNKVLFTSNLKGEK
jgi:predicted RNA-binding protein